MKISKCDRYLLDLQAQPVRSTTPPPTVPQPPSTPTIGSQRVLLEGVGDTRLINISSPSRAHQAAADTLNSLATSLLSSNTSPSSMVGTPLHEAKTTNIRTSIVDTISPGHTGDGNLCV